MFTGIVQQLAEVVAADDLENLRRLTLDLGPLSNGLVSGASVSVNGTCLTVAGLAGHRVHFDVIRETLQRTNLSRLEPGRYVNVERSFRVGDEVGGHIVSGHIDGMAAVTRIDRAANERVVHLAPPPELMKYIMPKGFLALDGASLTVAALDREVGALSVCLIPETIARTTLGSVVEGGMVNVEVDSQTRAVVETVERVLAEHAATGSAG